MRALLLCVFGGLGGISGAVQAQALPAALAACRAQVDPMARLACYDAIGRPAAPALRDQAAASIPAPAATPAAAVATPATTALAPADFGLPQVRLPSASEMLESRIAGRFEGWDPGTRLTLANGQVWEVLDTKRVSYDLPSPAVRVKRGMLGSFFIEIDGVTATPRVRRVQ